MQALVESLDAAVFSLDRECRYTSFNSSHAQMMRSLQGVEIELGHCLLEYSPTPAHRSETRGILDRVLRGEQVAVETSAGDDESGRRSFEMTYSPIKGQAGRVTGIAVSARDITDRKCAEQALLESEERLAALIDSAPVGIVLHAADGSLLLANPASQRLLGRAQRDLEGKGPRDQDWRFLREDGALMAPDEYAINQVLSSRLPLMDFLMGAVAPSTGEVTWSLVNTTPLLDSAGQISEMVVTAMDVTERKRAEQERERLLHEAEQRAAETEAIFMALSDGVLIYDTGMNVRRANPAFRTRYGFDPTGLNVRDVIERVSCRWLDGRPFALDDQPTPRALRGESVTGALFLVTKGDGSEAVVETSSGPMKVGDRFAGSVTVWHDLTELKRAEALVRSSLKEKEVLLKEIHHRVKNNLQIIASMLNLQAAAVGQESDRAALLESRNRVRTIALIHEKLYGSKDLTRVPFRDYLEELSSFLAGSFNGGSGLVSLQLDVEDLALEVGSAIPLALIVTELLSNAFKHAFRPATEGQVRIGLRRLPNGSLELTVADDGVGLPESIDVHATETLGLQIVSVLTQQIAGTLTLHRESGTRFVLTFAEGA